MRSIKKRLPADPAPPLRLQIGLDNFGRAAWHKSAGQKCRACQKIQGDNVSHKLLKPWTGASGIIGGAPGTKVPGTSAKPAKKSSQGNSAGQKSHIEHAEERRCKSAGQPCQAQGPSRGACHSWHRCSSDRHQWPASCSPTSYEYDFPLHPLPQLQP